MAGEEWGLFAFSLFDEQLRELTESVEVLRTDLPDTFGSHPLAELLLCVRNALRQVPLHPFDAEYSLGSTLKEEGKKLKPKFKDSMSHWRRVKKRMPDRYRLFFWAKSQPLPKLVFAWINDETCIRQAGGRRDVYRVFCELLRAGEVPNDFDALLAAALGRPGHPLFAG